MAASALPVMPRGLGYDQRCLDRVAQPDETVAQFDLAVKRLDLVLQMRDKRSLERTSPT
jgi:hypothetical protein